MSTDPLLNGDGIVCCRCLVTMTTRESVEDALYLGRGGYLCPRCQYPPPVIVRD